MMSPYEPASQGYTDFKEEVQRRMPEFNYTMASPDDVSPVNAVRAWRFDVRHLHDIMCSSLQYELVVSPNGPW